MVTNFDNVNFTELRHGGRQLCDELQKSADVLRCGYVLLGPAGVRTPADRFDSDCSSSSTSREPFDKLGIATQVKPKARMIDNSPVAAWVSSGAIEIGFEVRASGLDPK
jgi:hypothetical protein